MGIGKDFIFLAEFVFWDYILLFLGKGVAKECMHYALSVWGIKRDLRSLQNKVQVYGCSVRESKGTGKFWGKS